MCLGLPKEKRYDQRRWGQGAGEAWRLRLTSHMIDMGFLLKCIDFDKWYKSVLFDVQRESLKYASFI